jgi:hypothetical protein
MDILSSLAAYWLSIRGVLMIVAALYWECLSSTIKSGHLFGSQLVNVCGLLADGLNLMQLTNWGSAWIWPKSIVTVAGSW